MTNPVTHGHRMWQIHVDFPRSGKDLAHTEEEFGRSVGCSFSTARRSFSGKLMSRNTADSYFAIWQPDLAKFHVEIRILVRMTAMFELIFIHVDRHIIRIVNGSVIQLQNVKHHQMPSGVFFGQNLSQPGQLIFRFRNHLP